MTIPAIYFLWLRAPNTPNGNPNRVFVAVDVVHNTIVGAWDEGYRGLDAIPREWKGAGFYGTSSPLAIEVKASEAKAFLREGRAALQRAGARENPRQRKRPARFVYIVDMDERGVFSSHVEDEQGKDVWSASSEDEEDGVFWPVRDGFMRSGRDMNGLAEYLKDLGILIPGDALHANEIGRYNHVTVR